MSPTRNVTVESVSTAMCGKTVFKSLAGNRRDVLRIVDPMVRAEGLEPTLRRTGT
jgi:hypothetical protein